MLVRQIVPAAAAALVWGSSECCHWVLQTCRLLRCMKQLQLLQQQL
jgi:hypothetical protein